MAKILSEEFDISGDMKGIKIVTGVNRAKVGVRDKKAEVSRRKFNIAVFDSNGVTL